MNGHDFHELVMRQTPPTLDERRNLLTPTEVAARIHRTPSYVEWLVENGHLRAARRCPTRVEVIELETFLMGLDLRWEHAID